MRVEIELWKIRCSVFEVESLDGLRSIRVQDFDGIRCDRFTRPHKAAMFRWDDEKRFYGNVTEAIEHNLGWLTEGRE